DGAVLYWTGVEVEGVFTSRKSRDDFGTKLRTEAPPDGASSSASANATKPKELYAFEPRGIEERSHRFTTHPSRLIAAVLLEDGMNLVTIETSQSAQSDASVLSGEQRDLRSQTRKTLFSGLPYYSGGVAPLARKAQKKLYRVGTDGLMEIDTLKGTARAIKVAVDVSHDQDALRRAAFDQFWTLTKKRLFAPAMNGVDWVAVRARYE